MPERLSLVREFASIIASIPAEARCILAETAAGVSLIEAVRADEFETTLRMLTTSEAERDALRQGALDIARLGVPADAFAEAIRLWARGDLTPPTPGGEQDG